MPRSTLPATVPYARPAYLVTRRSYARIITVCRVVHSSIPRQSHGSSVRTVAAGTYATRRPAPFTAWVATMSSLSAVPHLAATNVRSNVSRRIGAGPPHAKLSFSLKRMFVPAAFHAALVADARVRSCVYHRYVVGGPVRGSRRGGPGARSQCLGARASESMNARTSSLAAISFAAPMRAAAFPVAFLTGSAVATMHRTRGFFAPPRT